ncbi:MAG TPA: hypothetical protein VF173_18180 [Thermoanaerobaculia bacterium]|nr:hypothetical protein [Thermoanaerobaculia bacterium]
MKLKSTFLAFASLLLIGHLASAIQTSTPADPASANLAAIFTAPAPPDGADVTLPSFEPAPMNKAISCGSCSDSLCQGRSVGTVCKLQGTKVFKCQLAFVVCSANDCECWNGPLP